MNVSEFSKRVRLSPHTIRYYDKIGLIGNIHRLPNGHRNFTENDVEWIEFVQRLKDTGMPLEKILEYAHLREKGEETLLARKKLLIEHSIAVKKTISTQQMHLRKLNYKIALYQSALEGKITLD
jgi:DNA-binding transcriptional MerR regulator